MNQRSVSVTEVWRKVGKGRSKRRCSFYSIFRGFFIIILFCLSCAELCCAVLCWQRCANEQSGAAVSNVMVAKTRLSTPGPTLYDHRIYPTRGKEERESQSLLQVTVVCGKGKGRETCREQDDAVGVHSADRAERGDPVR